MKNLTCRPQEWRVRLWGLYIYLWNDLRCMTTVSLSSNTQLEEVKNFAYTGWTKYLVNRHLHSTRNAQVRLTLERFKEECKEPILVLTTIYQIWLYVYSVVLKRDEEWSSGRKGMVIGAQIAREESVMPAIDVKRTVMGPLHLSMELLAWPLSCYRQIPNWRK